MKFMFRGTHPEDLDDGRILEPEGPDHDGSVELTDDQAKLPKAAQLLADGVLIGTGQKSQQVAAKAEPPADPIPNAEEAGQ